MTTANQPEIPEVGQAVYVRNRLATVRAVEPYDTRTAQGRLNIVDVEYLDDFRYPEAEQLLWEVESTAKILGKTSLPGVDAHRPDDPKVLQAFINAHRWTRLNRLREGEGIENEPLLGIWNSAIQVHYYQLPGPLILKRDGCHTWKPEDFPSDDPRHGWTWDDCWKDAVALLGSEEAVKKYIADKPEPKPDEDGEGEEEEPFQLRADQLKPRQKRMF